MTAETGCAGDRDCRVQAVLFDFDGTLTLPGAIDFAAIRAAVGCPPDQLILEYIAGLEEEAERSRCLEVVEQFEIVSAAVSMPNSCAEEVVARLRSYGLKLGIISRNGLASIDRAFLNFRTIDQSCFQVIISRDVPTRPKPAPDGVLLAARMMEVEPSRMLMVGDYVLDIQAGAAAGAITVFLEDRWRLSDFDERADYVIHDLAQLVAIALR